MNRTKVSGIRTARLSGRDWDRHQLDIMPLLTKFYGHSRSFDDEYVEKLFKDRAVFVLGVLLERKLVGLTVATVRRDLTEKFFAVGDIVIQDYVPTQDVAHNLVSVVEEYATNTGCRGVELLRPARVIDQVFIERHYRECGTMIRKMF